MKARRDEARRKAMEGDSELVNEVERPDWEVESVSPND